MQKKVGLSKGQVFIEDIYDEEYFMNYLGLFAFQVSMIF